MDVYPPVLQNILHLYPSSDLLFLYPLQLAALFDEGLKLEKSYLLLIQPFVRQTGRVDQENETG